MLRRLSLPTTSYDFGLADVHDGGPPAAAGIVVMATVRGARLMNNRALDGRDMVVISAERL